MAIPKLIQAVASHQAIVGLSDGRQTPSTSNQTGQFRRNVLPDNQTSRDLDLMTRVKGMYRLLTLYKEQGSGGLVDKILIAQESLADLMNKLVPRSHTSITKIDFASLDQASIQPLGVYGDKAALTNFLHIVTNIDDETAAHLINPTSTTSRLNLPTLASGLYFLLPDKEPHSANETFNHPAFVIYWPEDTTWNDNAVGAVRRNRTTFMRYLTKLTPQIRSLISKELADTRLEPVPAASKSVKRCGVIYMLWRLYNVVCLVLFERLCAGTGRTHK